MKPPADPASATALWNLARLHHTQRRLSLARGEYEAALEAYERLADLCPDAYLEHVARVSVDLGGLLQEVGADEQAMCHLRKAIDLSVRVGVNVLPTPDNWPSALTGESSARCAPHRRDADEADDVRTATAFPTQRSGALDEATCRDLSHALRRLSTTGASSAEGCAWDAIAIAESVARQSGGLHLAKGAAVSAYRRYLLGRANAAAGNDVFRAIAALRETDVLLCAKDTDDGLAVAQEALQSCGRDLHRRIGVVVAEDLGPDGVFFAALTAERFAYEIVNPVPNELRPRFFPRHIQSLLDRKTDGASLPDQMRQGTESWDDVAENRVVDIAHGAWQALPTLVRDLLTPNSGFDVGICGDSVWTLFPWEALRFEEEDDGWLGIRRLLPRWQAVHAPSWVRMRRRVVGDGERATGIICPWNVCAERPLRKAAKECADVSGILSRSGYPCGGESSLLGPAACRANVEQLFRRPHGIIHYAGHGEVADGEEHLVIFAGSTSGRTGDGGRCLFGREQLRALSARGGSEMLFSHGPLVVLSACDLGTPRQHGGRREDLPSAFLAEGACAVLATPFPLNDLIAEDLSVEFYRESCANPSRDLGESFVAARNTVSRLCSRATARPLWAAMTYYGNPYVTLS